ncbi:MAG: ABC transporter permease subunit [Bacilli bacterium]|nr:ABC transporter permease subunit [Bacilli bacterium]
MKKYTIKINYWFFYGIVFIFLLWFIASYLMDNSLVIPKISEVFSAFINMFKEKQTYLVIFNTMLRLLMTVGVSFVIALILSLISYVSSKFREFIRPLMTLMRTIPVAAIIIILLMIFGNVKSPYIITLLIVLPIMYEAFLLSFQSIDRGITDEIKMISGVNFETIKGVYIPLIMPQIFSALVSTIGLGLKVMVMSEFIAQPNNTIGYMMLQEKNFLEMANVFAWTIVLIIFILIVEEILKIIKLKLL